MYVYVTMKSTENLKLSPLRVIDVRAITIERSVKKRRKELIPKMKQRRIRAITLKEAIEKGPILLSQF